MSGGVAIWVAEARTSIREVGVYAGAALETATAWAAAICALVERIGQTGGAGEEVAGDTGCACRGMGFDGGTRTVGLAPFLCLVGVFD